MGEDSGTPAYPTPPDGRYFVVRGRLWRRTGSARPEKRRIELASKLMQARRAVRSALRENDVAGLAEARASVDRAKVALGERGPVWWSDDAPDLNRRMVAGTPHAAWFAQPKV